MAPPRAAAAAGSPPAPRPSSRPPPPPPPRPPPETEGPEPESSEQQDADSLWLQTLSERELDLLISIRELAVTRATDAGHPELAGRFHLRTLRALGVILLEDFKSRLHGSTSVNTNTFDRLALLRDPDVDVPAHRSDSDPEIVRTGEGQPVPDQINRKRKQTQNETHDEGALGPKKRKMEETRDD
ncbi:hypothetical protein ACP4OV_014066 [Aristida adscensionis]